jgi:hypothetical protein
MRDEEYRRTTHDKEAIDTAGDDRRPPRAPAVHRPTVEENVVDDDDDDINGDVEEENADEKNTSKDYPSAMDMDGNGNNPLSEEDEEEEEEERHNEKERSIRKRDLDADNNASPPATKKLKLVKMQSPFTETMMIITNDLREKGYDRGTVKDGERRTFKKSCKIRKLGSTQQTNKK